MDTNCPDELYANCVNSFSGCADCQNYSNYCGSPKFLEDLLSKQKRQKQSKTTRRQAYRRAIESERNSLKSLKATIGSGNVRHDGDALHQDFRIEHKHRSRANCVTVTAAELNKGKSQAIDIFELEIASGEVYYVMPRKIYALLLQAYLQKYDKL